MGSSSAREQCGRYMEAKYRHCFVTSQAKNVQLSVSSTRNQNNIARDSAGDNTQQHQALGVHSSSTPNKFVARSSITSAYHSSSAFSVRFSQNGTQQHQQQLYGVRGGNNTSFTYVKPSTNYDKSKATTSVTTQPNVGKENSIPPLFLSDNMNIFGNLKKIGTNSTDCVTSSLSNHNQFGHYF